jgi:ubiquinol oxidase
MRKLLVRILLLPALTTAAFSLLPPHRTLLRRSQQSSIGLFPALQEETKAEIEECEITPSTVFGRPVNDATKERNKVLIRTLKGLLFDTIFQGTSVERTFARFYALETIARMPYFAYLSVLHLYETIGSWRNAEYLKVHFAESMNELHHLLIMEELGGNARFIDRFVAQHVAVFYYWIVVTLYIVNPTSAYNLNQAVEEEAYETYNKFINDNEAFLKERPAPLVAVNYYTNNDMYLFDAQQIARGDDAKPRRPPMKTMYDCFVAIRDDEMEHAKTMAHLQTDGCETSR